MAELSPRRKKRKTGPPLPRDWQARYVAAVRATGLYYLASEAAGVSHKTAERYRASDPAFAAACETARETVAEELEDKLVKLAEKTGNPIGILARLKAMGKTQYVEQHLVRQLSLTVNADFNSDPTHTAALLRAMLAHSTDATRNALTLPAPHET